MDVIQICVFLTIVLRCNGLSILDQLAHIQSLAQRRYDNRRIPKIMRRYSLPGEPSVIIGAPSYSYHLPPAEPILPGHTLIRPTLGMLKSSIKFPHREQENGSGVYGNIDKLGIKYDGKNERVLYTGFRRSQPWSQNMNARRSMSNNPYLYRSMSNNPYLYRRRHLESNPPNHREPLLNKLSDDVHKVLTISPVKIQKKKHYYKGTYPYEQFTPNGFTRRSLDDVEPEGVVLGQVIVVKKETDLLNIFRIIKSLRRDQELQAAKLYVPGTANFGYFSGAESDSENNGVLNKTAMFWKTKDAFNHIKINPEAPDHSDFIPADADDNQRNWWFYHQLDFENFEDS